MSSPVYWESVFQGNQPRILKALYGSFLIRDDLGQATSLANFTPFAADGNLDGTLIGLAAGQQGWFDVGYLDKNGVQFRPKYATTDTDVWQSRMAARTDVTQDQEMAMVNGVESNPLTDYISWQLPLDANIPDIGSENYKLKKPIVPQMRYRQCLALGVDGSSGNNEYFATLFTRALMTKPGDYDYNASKEVQAPWTFESYPSPWSGFAVARFREGPAWRASGGSTAAFASAPVAVASSGGKANLTVTAPVSPNAPFTYTAQMQTGGTGAFTAVPAGQVSVVSHGATQDVIQVTGLTTGTAYVFKLVAVGTNGSANAPSLASNSITALA